MTFLPLEKFPRIESLPQEAEVPGSQILYYTIDLFT